VVCVRWGSAEGRRGVLGWAAGGAGLGGRKEQGARGCTVVWVAHDASRAAWADRGLLLRDGLIVDQSGAAASHLPRLAGPSAALSLKGTTGAGR